MAKGMRNSTSKLHYIKPCIKEWENVHNNYRQYKVKLSKIIIGCTRLTHGHLMSRNYQPPTCRSAACGNQRLTIKTLPIILMGKDCEVMMMMMRFLREMGIFEEI